MLFGLSACGGGDSTDDVAPSYSVTYDANGAGSGSVPVDSTTYEQSNTVTVLGNTGNLAKTGYTFAGWCVSASGTGTSYAQGQTLTIGSAGVTLYAKWTLIPTYAITYNGNGNTSGSVPTDSTNYEEGATVTVLGNTGNLAKDPDGIFIGWNTEADGSGTLYAPLQSITMGAANVTLYARWSALLGEGPAGGFIFYDKGSYSDGWRYMEAAPASTEWTGKQWGADGSVVGVTGTAIGLGRGNTAAIVSWLDSHGEADRAAQLCDSLGYGGYSDWFLPSNDELIAMRTLKDNGIGGIDSMNYYWSSSEYIGSPSVGSWSHEFYFNNLSALPKTQNLRVRAVRVF
jgi:uncharacterized repeat protein (TIGR02543 family)